MNHQQIIDFWTLLASAGSLWGCYFLYRESFRFSSPLMKSDLGLPFYFAGIIQWFLFGIFSKNWILIITCGMQIPLLVLSFKNYLKVRAK